MRQKSFILLGMVVGLFLFFGSQAQADDMMFGVRAGGYFDAEAGFIGGEVLVPVSGDHWYFNPNLEYVFVDRGDLITFNFDFHYDLPTDDFYFWLGAGPAILYFNPERDVFDSDTDIGVNLFVGLGFKVGSGRVVPYVQPKVIIADNSEFALAVGLRF